MSTEGSGQAGEPIDAQAFIEQHGLEDVAHLTVEAHGNVYTVVEAIAQCPPFAKNIMAQTVSLEKHPLTAEAKREILVDTIREQAKSAPETIPAVTPELQVLVKKN